MLGQAQHYNDQARVYHDLAGIQQLKTLAGKDRAQGIEAVAQQFEAMLLQMMLSSMRQAGEAFAEGGLFDSHEHRVYRDMMDQQVALDLAHGRGIGLADIIVRQLQPAAHNDSNTAARAGEAPIDRMPRLPVRWLRPQGQAEHGSADSATASATTETAATNGGRNKRPVSAGETFAGPEDFVQRMRPLARTAAAELGVSPEVLLSQAALETGWGQHQLRHADGRPSHNFFNIKADSRWNGPVVNVITLEYRDGVAVRERASFRAYDSAEESFADYVSFIRSGARYQAALAQAGDDQGYVRELAAAGYATDPLYADKILDLAGRDVMRATGGNGLIQ